MEIRQCAGCVKTFGVKDDSPQDYCSIDCEKINGGRSGKWGAQKRLKKAQKLLSNKKAKKISTKIAYISEEVLREVNERIKKTPNSDNENWADVKLDLEGEEDEKSAS